MRAAFSFAQASGFSSLDTLFAASVVLGFAFALLLVLAGGKAPRVRPFKLGRTRLSGRIRLTGSKGGQTSLWESVPGAIPVRIGSFLIGFGLTGLALRTLLPAFWTALGALLAGALFSTLFLSFVARYFGGGAKEESGSALIGAIARVTLEIPAQGVGKIAFERDGRRGTMPARSNGGRALSKDTQTFVVGVVSGTALVEEL